MSIMNLALGVALGMALFHSVAFIFGLIGTSATDNPDFPQTVGYGIGISLICLAGFVVLTR